MKEKITNIITDKSNIAFVIAVIFIIVLFKCIIINAYIPSESMENTLMIKDRVIGLRLDKNYKRGNIVIFKYDKDTYYIKRIIGIGGDEVKIISGNVFVNGEKLYEPYVKEKIKNFDDQIYNVPENSYFFLGDNRNNSADSRFWDNPFRTKDEIVAKAVFRYWPIDKAKILK